MDFHTQTNPKNIFPRMVCNKTSIHTKQAQKDPKRHKTQTTIRTRR